jgi:hypothetical protein
VMPAALLLIGDRIWGRRRPAERQAAPAVETAVQPTAETAVETEPVPAGVGSAAGGLPPAEQSAR